MSNWEDKIPPWLTPRTYKIAAAFKMRAEDIGIDVGTPMKSERNGDSMWFILTDGSKSLLKKGKEAKEVQRLTIVLCTPHCILIEDNYHANEVKYSMLNDSEEFLSFLKGLGMRALTDEEMEKFLNGTL